ncbi:uncharacterized protein C8Q71DRAFT_910545 [Rhodofomes roseus]|uniref:Uncharacterized protein n=1 Tax=Rhodofomes roseus TaxID=34475 RepID=A0ABQ8K3Q3_9APHY|nr:uncharacterized protein C8Q71DRAFT_910545 [Rhodofomes roseus]KAH9831517.1 hypothetical protein C8Q71DRAFT_910545 [Rhodofomes roseus]
MGYPRAFLAVISCLVLLVVVLNRSNPPNREEPPASPLSESDVDVLTMHWTDDLIEADPRLEDQNNYTSRTPIPLVSREVLNKLQRVGASTIDDDSDDRIGQGDHRYSSPRQHRWPPIVTALPEARASASYGRQKAGTPAASTDNAIDAQFCGRAPCRLLVPLLVTERAEPKVQEQLLQILALARQLNRTVVLPNVGKGRIGTCLRWDFDTYFDIASTARWSGERVMMMDDFRTWVDMRLQSPTTQVVTVDEGATDAVGRVEYSPTILEKAMKNMRCFKTRFRSLKLDDVGTTSVHLSLAGDLRAVPGEAALLVGTLDDRLDPPGSDGSALASSSELAADDALTFATGATHPLKLVTAHPLHNEADILLLHWDVHHEVFPTSQTASIDYSPRLWALADKMTEDLQPYLAVHWHTDKLPPAVLTACADALVDMLDILLHNESVNYGIRTVYFSSDFPLLENPKEGQKRLLYMHQEAGKIIRGAFAPGGELQRWSLETKQGLVRKTHGTTGAVDEDQLPLDDAGVQDMLAMTISMKAALFVSSTKGCGPVSSIAKQVTDFRARVENHKAIRNVASGFG